MSGSSPSRGRNSKRTPPMRPGPVERLVAEADPTLRQLNAAEKKLAAAEARNSILRGQVDDLHEQLAEMEARQGLLDFLANCEPQPAWPLAPRTKGNAAESTAVIVFTDWHVEEKVTRASVNGLNEYDLTIAAQRIRKATENALVLLEMARSYTNIEQVVVAVLGDLITGFIHPELRESNYLPPFEAIQFVEEHLTAALNTLIKHSRCKDMLVACSYGNHGRISEKPRVSTGAVNSYEWNLYCTLAKWFNPKPIRWQVSPSYHNWVSIQGHDVRLHHGDSIRYKGGVGGLSIPANKKIAQWNKARKAYLDVFGHYHQLNRDLQFHCSGTLMGFNAYAVEIGAPYDVPSQLFLCLNRKRGLILSDPIFCT